jgi:hypothetical protein
MRTTIQQEVEVRSSPQPLVTRRLRTFKTLLSDNGFFYGALFVFSVLFSTLPYLYGVMRSDATHLFMGETVYLLEGHVRRQIANLEVLEACGLASHPLKGVTETQLLELPAGHPVGEPPYWYDKLLPGPLRTLPLFHAAAKAC